MNAWEALHDDKERWHQYEEQQLRKKKAIQEVRVTSCSYTFSLLRILQHAAACAAWAADRAHARAEELDMARQRRLEL